MEQKRILIERDARTIARLTAILAEKCKAANAALLRIKEEVLPTLAVTDSIAKGIAERKPGAVLAAIRRRLEEENTSEIGIVRESQIDASLKMVERRIGAIFEETRLRMNGAFASAADDQYRWRDFVTFDGNEITFDEKAVEEANCTYIAAESPENDYLERARRLSEQMSEFIAVTEQLGSRYAISSDEDSVIFIGKRNKLILDARMIACLDFSRYADALEAAKQKVGFEEQTE